MTSLVRRVVGFGGVTSVATLSPIIVIPVLTTQFGPSVWAAVAVGQGVGLLVMALTGGGWGFIGPRAVQGLGVDDVAQLYRVSFLERIAVFLPWTLLGSVCAWAIAPSHGDVAAAMVPATSVWGLGAPWLFIALGRASGLLLWDTLPKLLATLGAAGLIAWHQSVWMYPISLCVVGTASVLGVAWFHWPSVPTVDWHDVWQSLRAHLPLVASAGATASYTTLTVPLVALLSPEAAAEFAAADRIRLYASVGLAAVGSAMVNWIYVNDRVDSRRRFRAIRLVLGAGTLLALLMTVSSNVVERIVFSSVVDPPLGVWVFQAATLVLIAVGNVLTFQCLVPMGATDWIARGALGGFIFGVPAVAIGSHVAGSVGASVGVFAAEVSVCVVLIVGLRWQTARDGKGRLCRTRL